MTRGSHTIAIEPPDQPEVLALIDELDAYQSTLYPAESNHFLDLAALSRPEVIFAVARDAQGKAVGCAALVPSPPAPGGTPVAPSAELKRMFVHPSARGRKLGGALLSFLEHEAMARGVHTLLLETGISQPEALGLYERAGFRRRGPFGNYADDPLSVFMQKDLRGGRRTAQ